MSFETNHRDERNSTLSGRLAFLRNKNKMSLEKVAELFKVDETAVLGWESEKFWQESFNQNKELLLLQLIELYQADYQWTLTGNETVPARSARVMVMVVDDDATSLTIMTLIIKSVLSPESEICGFTDAGLALDWASDNQSTLVFSDYRMPGLKGDNFIMSLRKLPAYRSIPIIGVTQAFEPGIREAMIAAGADIILQKPVNGTELSQVLEQICPHIGSKKPKQLR